MGKNSSGSGPTNLVDLGVEVVEPALAALLAEPPRAAVGDCGPLHLVHALACHHGDHMRILLLRPLPLLEAWLDHLGPPVLALQVGVLARVLGRDLLPIARAVRLVGSVVTVATASLDCVERKGGRARLAHSLATDDGLRLQAEARQRRGATGAPVRVYVRRRATGARRRPQRLREGGLEGPMES